MPRTSERQKAINESAVSMNRLRKHYMILLITKASKHFINNSFKACDLQCINHVKLNKNRYLELRKKNRIYEGRSVFMRHIKDKAGKKQCMNDKEFLLTCRMSRFFLKISRCIKGS